MKIPRAPHSWSVSPSRAVEIQRLLAARVKQKKLQSKPRFVAGIDVAFARDGASCIAATVVWDCLAARVVEERVAHRPLRFPYVPGLLSFREAPAALAALRKLRRTPDLLICDGQGYAHPRRFGLACHVGVLVDRPTLGCAKSVLCGQYRQPARRRGSRTALTHRSEVVGTVLRTRDGVRPVFVSVGHRIDLRSAERVVLMCGAGYRLPEPTRLADHLVAAVKRSRLRNDRD